MLRHTFLHVRGVGYRTEERLWRAGVRSWEDFPARGASARLPQSTRARIEDALGASAEALRRGAHRYFARTLPPPEHWRAWSDFRAHAAYVDIETTGLSFGRDAITVVGVYDGRRERSFVRDENLDAFPEALDRAKLLVTFNGARFDLPFLRRAFPRLREGQLHVDLLHPLRRLGFRGGLKAIERQVGIDRSDETATLRGSDAVRLWRAHEMGDPDALELLLDYNMEDAVNLEPLARIAYDGLRRICLEGGFVTGDRLAPAHGRDP